MKFLTPRMHSIIGFIVGIALILAPWIFGFSDVGGAAVWVPRIIGVIIVIAELTVKGSFSGMGMIPMKTHIMTDVVLGIILAASPWIFGFSDESANAWLPHLIVGLVIIGYALVTRTNDEERAVESKS